MHKKDLQIIGSILMAAPIVMGFFIGTVYAISSFTINAIEEVDVVVHESVEQDVVIKEVEDVEVVDDSGNGVTLRELDLEEDSLEVRRSNHSAPDPYTSNLTTTVGMLINVVLGLMALATIGVFCVGVGFLVAASRKEEEKKKEKK